jgi:hypothetical protein
VDFVGHRGPANKRLWAAHKTDARAYYLGKLGAASPLFWPLWPAALLLLYRTDRRVGIFLGVATVVALVIHSVAAQKAIRYVAYVWPWICVVLGNRHFAHCILVWTEFAHGSMDWWWDMDRAGDARAGDHAVGRRPGAP